MERGLAGMSLEGSEILASIEAVQAAGYDVIELRLAPVEAFLAQGHSIEELAAVFENVPIRPHVLCAVLDIEIPEGPQRRELIAYYRRVCETAAGIGCRNVQVVSGATFAGASWATIRRETGRGLREMADIGAEYGVAPIYEPIAWWPVRTAAQSVEVIEEAGRDNVGLLMDSFHIFAGEDDLESIRKLDPALMPSVHLGDCTARKADVWSDLERAPMPGDGIVPLKTIMAAIMATGYDGAISDEVWPEPYSDWDRTRLFSTLKAKGDAILTGL